MSDASAQPAGPAPPAAAAPAAATPPPPRWAIHRRTYDWVLSWAHSKHSTVALFILSFTESSFFPVPPDVLQIALTLERRDRAWFYAAVSTIASVLGGAFGYLLGTLAWEALDQVFYDYIPGFTPELFEKVKAWYQEHDFLIIFTAAFTPIPYKVFTVTGGVTGVFFPMFLVASAVGRGARFFLVAGLLWWFGPPMKKFIEKYFNLLTILFVLAVIAGFVVIKWIK
jgi:membrane protein YqaA with SNARE-associated domain